MCWRVILSIMDISSFASKSARIHGWIDRQMYGSSERLQGLVLIRFASPRCCPLCPSSSTWLPRRFFFLSSKRKVKRNPARDCKRNPEKCAEMQRCAELLWLLMTSYDFLDLFHLVSSCFPLWVSNCGRCGRAGGILQLEFVKPRRLPSMSKRSSWQFWCRPLAWTDTACFMS
jgi:hypothetical protein